MCVSSSYIACMQSILFIVLFSCVSSSYSYSMCSLCPLCVCGIFLFFCLTLAMHKTSIYSMQWKRWDVNAGKSSLLNGYPKNSDTQFTKASADAWKLRTLLLQLLPSKKAWPLTYLQVVVSSEEETKAIYTFCRLLWDLKKPRTLTCQHRCHPPYVGQEKNVCGLQKYCTHALLSTCVYISSGSKWVLNSEGVPNNEYTTAE